MPDSLESLTLGGMGLDLGTNLLEKLFQLSTFSKISLLATV